MTSDLISRQAAIEAIDAVFPVDPMKSEYVKGIACGVALAKTYVEQLPSAQPERKKGKWTGVEGLAGIGIFVCDQCAGFALMETDFCPNCGADMREERRE